mmetsp:Transcript_24666/g.28549  ORF Transcript_24666/g.28549 Transcript_24666/m.28549 type:complete len:430 (-) Transcript_24666:173-1462(-)
MKLANSLSTVLWVVSVVSMSMLLVPGNVSAAWYGSSDNTTEEVEKVKKIKEVKVNDAVPASPPKRTLASEIPVMFKNKSSMALYINWVNRETQEEKPVVDILLPSGVLEIQSHPGHMFVAFNEERTLRLFYFVEEGVESMKFVITEEDISPDREVMAKFINTSSKSVHINFINLETKEEQPVAHNLEPLVGEIDEDADDTKPQQGVVIIQSHPGHVFAIFDEERSFRTLLTVDPDGHTHGDQALFKITEFETDPLACKARFINSLSTQESVSVNWVNPETGDETVVIDKLLPNEARSILARKGHIFHAYDAVDKLHKYTFRTEFVIHNSNGDQQFLHITGVNGSATADKTYAKFINVSPNVVHINYIDEETNEEYLVKDNLRPQEDQVLETHSGHQFVAYDEERTFRKVYTMNVDKGMMESHHIDPEEL